MIKTILVSMETGLHKLLSWEGWTDKDRTLITDIHRQIDPAAWRELIRRGLIRRDRYGSWVLTGAGKDLYHQHKKGRSS